MRHLIAEVERGGRVESCHYGRIAIVDAENRDVLNLANDDAVVFPRSTVKPLLALPFVESGAAGRLHVTDAELAVICASHNGETAHTETVHGILHRAGQTISCLECGAQWPLYGKASHALAASGAQPSPLHNNCSGKHSALVCLALDQKISVKGYIKPDHPVQKQVTRALIDITDTPHTKENLGIDGCSMPTYAIPLRQLALAFARFGTGFTFNRDRQAAATRVRHAIAANPFMVAGSERFDTRLMQHFRDRLFCKMGAEGVMVASCPEAGIGIAIKVDDGANRAAEVALAGLLRQVLENYWSSDDLDLLTQLSSQTLRNWNGVEIGRVRSVDRF